MKRQSQRRRRVSSGPTGPRIGYRPSPTELAAAQAALAPWRALTSPRFFGLSNAPTERPALYVGNHTIMGVLDVPLLAMALYERRGVFVRSLGDHLHFWIPGWRDLLVQFGTVDGTRENCRALMRAGESVLVFPGGGREVCKRRGEKYTLIWKERIGFARLAIEHGYTIVPFASVGAEECFDIVLDGNDLMATPIGRLIERVSPRPEMIPPVVRGIGLTPLPRPERFYFRLDRPIETAHLRGEHRNTEVCFELREQVRHSVERSIRYLQRQRAADPGRWVSGRLRAALQSSD